MRIPNPRHKTRLVTSVEYRTNGRKPAFSDATVLEIKRRVDSGASQIAIAKEYNVTPQTIRNALVRAEFASSLRETYQLDRI